MEGVIGDTLADWWSRLGAFVGHQVIATAATLLQNAWAGQNQQRIIAYLVTLATAIVLDALRSHIWHALLATTRAALSTARVLLGLALRFGALVLFVYYTYGYAERVVSALQGGGRGIPTDCDGVLVDGIFVCLEPTPS